MSASVMGVQSLFISIKESWICVMNRNHAKLNKILLTINLLFGSDSEAIL